MPDGRSALVDVVAAHWMSLLKKDSIAPDDNFFFEGGTSLLAMRLVAAVKKELNNAVAVRWIFDNPTFAGFVRVLESELRPTGLNQHEKA